jgi:cytochrome b561
MNYITDALMFVSFVIVAISGVIMYFLNPKGQDSRIYLNLHVILGFLLVVLVIVHLILHWKWIVAMTKNR